MAATLALQSAASDNPSHPLRARRAARATRITPFIVFVKSASRARRPIPRIVADETSELSGLAREMLASLVEFLRQLDERIEGFDRRIGKVFRQSQPCQRIATMLGWS